MKTVREIVKEALTMFRERLLTPIISNNDTKHALTPAGAYTILQKANQAITNITRNGTTFTATKNDGSTMTFTQQDNDTWIPMMGASQSANGGAGYVPAPPSNGYNTKFLRADGMWQIPPNFRGATASSAGDVGYVPAPPANGYNTRYLRADGTWQVPPDNNTLYPKAITKITRSGTTFTAIHADGTTSTFTQQDNNTWTPMKGATASASGAAGYVPAPPASGYNARYLRADGTWQIPPDNNTTYPNAITNISRSGTTFTATRANGTQFTFTQQDTNTTYPKAITSIYRSGLTFYATHADGSTSTFTQQDTDSTNFVPVKTTIDDRGNTVLVGEINAISREGACWIETTSGNVVYRLVVGDNGYLNFQKCVDNGRTVVASRVIAHVG